MTFLNTAILKKVSIVTDLFLSARKLQIFQDRNMFILMFKFGKTQDKRI